ncbi:hypothetical protein G6011_05791 [Alternaria panax]|uniref:Uncharacterized protein n=1 Tax=Alternaria panax TaxID=48097 RepID=A0AAD4I3Z2_9PLEO|nr:hypothetical protein G6011_05791 [Alternaria panax]
MWSERPYYGYEIDPYVPQDSFKRTVLRYVGNAEHEVASHTSSATLRFYQIEVDVARALPAQLEEHLDTVLLRARDGPRSPNAKRIVQQRLTTSLGNESTGIRGLAGVDDPNTVSEAPVISRKLNYNLSATCPHRAIGQDTQPAVAAPVAWRPVVNMHYARVLIPSALCFPCTSLRRVLSFFSTVLKDSRTTRTCVSLRGSKTQAKGFGADTNPVVNMLSSTMRFFRSGVRTWKAHNSATVSEVTGLRFANISFRTELCRVVKKVLVVSHRAKERNNNRALGDEVALVVVLMGRGVRNAGLLRMTPTEQLFHHGLNIWLLEGSTLALGISDAEETLRQKV